MAKDSKESHSERGKRSKPPKLKCEKCGNATFTDAIETSLFISLACSKCGERALIIPQDLELHFPSGTGLQG